jgi:redox-sensitive bicupin YhaK (pirin superfamily)
MITVRQSEERGTMKIDWLNSKHTFSFGEYYDPNHMGYGVLRVINDDVIQPSGGFGTHPHENMEIVTYVLQGALEHKDSMGNGSVIQAGDVQRMSAGTGITHSEFNHSDTENVHLLQIWFLPKKRDIEPGYEQKQFPCEEKVGNLKLVASQTGREGSVSLNQDVDMYACILQSDGEPCTHEIRSGRHAWVHVARGEVSMNGQKMKGGDGAAVDSETSLTFEDAKDAEFIIFDMGKK